MSLSNVILSVVPAVSLFDVMCWDGDIERVHLFQVNLFVISIKTHK